MSKRTLTKSLMPLFLASAVLGMNALYTDKNGEHRELEARPLVRGYEHKAKTQEQLEARKERRKKFKAKRNAKKGLYAIKIEHPRNRAKR